MKNIGILFLSAFLISSLGCSKKGSPQAIDLKMGQPGQTEVENKLPKNENVKSLEKDETINFTSDSGEATIIHHTEREIKKDDIIVANEEQRYLVRVKEVKETSPGRTQVVLRQARIADIVGDKSGSLKFESTPVYDIEDVKKIIRQAERKKGDGKTQYEVDDRGRVIIRNMELFSLNLNNDGNINVGGLNKILGIPIKNPYQKFTISSGAGGLYKATVNEAIIEVLPTIRSEADWKWGKIKTMQTRLDTKVRYRLDISYEAAGAIKMEALIDAFMPKKVIPFRVAGAPPVYLDIELGIPAGVTFEASKKGKTRIIFESDYEFYSTMNYDKKTGITTEKDQKVNILDKKIETQTSDTKLTAELFLKPQVTTRLYRVMGPYAYLKPYVRGEIEWPSKKKKDDLFIGVTGGVGLELSEPIFLSNIVSFDSGKLFDFYKSFDLDGAGENDPNPLTLKTNVNNTVSVDKVGPEGFVRLQLKEHKEKGFLNYELIQSTQTGLLVPSENFYIDGELFYYPMPDSKDETFQVRIYGEHMSFQDVEVAIHVEEDVIKEVSKDRFGKTTNSYKVASGTPGQFKDQVPNHDLGGGLQLAGEQKPSSINECLSSDKDGHFLDDYNRFQEGGSCEHYNADYTKYLKHLESLGYAQSGDRGHYFVLNEGASQKLTQLKAKNISSTEAQYDFFNLISFADYMAYHKRGGVNCSPNIKIETVDTPTQLGLRFISTGCTGLIQPLGFNLQRFGKPFGSHGSLKWNRSNEEYHNNSIVSEITFPKSLTSNNFDSNSQPVEQNEIYKECEECEETKRPVQKEKIKRSELFGHVKLLVPLDPMIESYMVTTDDPRTFMGGHREHGPNTLYSFYHIDIGLNLTYDKKGQPKLSIHSELALPKERH